MPRPKSFLPKLLIDEAGSSHNCQHNKTHRIVKGAKRLKVIEGRSPEHFCVTCAIDSIRADLEKLQDLMKNLQATL